MLCIQVPTVRGLCSLVTPGLGQPWLHFNSGLCDQHSGMTKRQLGHWVLMLLSGSNTRHSSTHISLAKVCHIPHTPHRGMGKCSPAMCSEGGEAWDNCHRPGNCHPTQQIFQMSRHHEHLPPLASILRAKIGKLTITETIESFFYSHLKNNPYERHVSNISLAENIGFCLKKKNLSEYISKTISKKSRIKINVSTVYVIPCLHEDVQLNLQAFFLTSEVACDADWIRTTHFRLIVHCTISQITPTHQTGIAAALSILNYFYLLQYGGRRIQSIKNPFAPEGNYK